MSQSHHRRGGDARHNNKNNNSNNHSFSSTSSNTSLNDILYNTTNISLEERNAIMYPVSATTTTANSFRSASPKQQSYELSSTQTAAKVATTRSKLRELERSYESPHRRRQNTQQQQKSSYVAPRAIASVGSSGLLRPSLPPPASTILTTPSSSSSGLALRASSPTGALLTTISNIDNNKTSTTTTTTSTTLSATAATALAQSQYQRDSSHSASNTSSSNNNDSSGPQERRGSHQSFESNDSGISRDDYSIPRTRSSYGSNGYHHHDMPDTEKANIIMALEELKLDKEFAGSLDKDYDYSYSDAGKEYSTRSMPAASSSSSSRRQFFQPQPQHKRPEPQQDHSTRSMPASSNSSRYEALGTSNRPSSSSHSGGSIQMPVTEKTSIVAVAEGYKKDRPTLYQGNEKYQDQSTRSMPVSSFHSSYTSLASSSSDKANANNHSTRSLPTDSFHSDQAQQQPDTDNHVLLRQNSNSQDIAPLAPRRLQTMDLHSAAAAAGLSITSPPKSDMMSEDDTILSSGSPPAPPPPLQPKPTASFVRAASESRINTLSSSRQALTRGGGNAATSTSERRMGSITNRNLVVNTTPASMAASKSNSPSSNTKEGASSNNTQDTPTEYWNSYLDENYHKNNPPQHAIDFISPASTASSTSTTTTTTNNHNGGGSPASIRFQEMAARDSPEKQPYFDTHDEDDEDEDDDTEELNPTVDTELQTTTDDATTGETTTTDTSSHIPVGCLQFDPATAGTTTKVVASTNPRPRGERPVGGRGGELEFRATHSEIFHINETRKQNKALFNSDRDTIATASSTTVASASNSNTNHHLNLQAKERMDSQLLPPPTLAAYQQQRRQDEKKQRAQDASEHSRGVVVVMNHPDDTTTQTPTSSHKSTAASAKTSSMLLFQIPNTAVGICFCLAGHAYMWKVVEEQHAEFFASSNFSIVTMFWFAAVVAAGLLVLLYLYKLVTNPNLVAMEVQRRFSFFQLPHLTLIWIVLSMTNDWKNHHNTTTAPSTSPKALQITYVIGVIFQLILSLRQQQPSNNHNDETKYGYLYWSSLGWSMCALLGQEAAFESDYAVTFPLGIATFTYILALSSHTLTWNSATTTSSTEPTHNSLSTLIAVASPSVAAMVIYNFADTTNTDRSGSNGIVAQALLGWALWLLLGSLLRVGTKLVTETEASLGMHWAYLVSFVSVSSAALVLATDTPTEILAILLVALSSFALLVVCARTFYKCVLCYKNQMEWTDPILLCQQGGMTRLESRTSNIDDFLEDDNPTNDDNDNAQQQRKNADVEMGR